MAQIIAVFIMLYSCSYGDSALNKQKTIGNDYKLFQHTPTWNLAKAVASGNVSKMKELIRKDRQLVNNREPKYGQTLLMIAVNHRDYNSVKALVQLGANPNLQDTYDGNSALMRTVDIVDVGNANLTGDPKYLILLLKYGGDPNATQVGDSIKGNKTRFTVLQKACLSGVLEYVSILVKAGADVNLKAGSGVSPLFYAVISKNPDIVMFLLTHGADFRNPIHPELPGRKWPLIGTIDKVWNFQPNSDEFKREQEIKDWLRQRNVK